MNGGGGVPHIKYSKNKAHFSSHAQALAFLFLPLLLAPMCFAVQTQNTPVARLSAFVGRILLWYSSSPRQAWTCMFFFFPLPSLLPFPSLPPSRTARNWEIKGIEQRPHERHHLGGCVKFPREAFPVRVARTAETGPARPRGREEEHEEN